MPCLRIGLRGVVLAAGLAMAASGCSGPPTARYEMLPVEGRVTMDGTPLVRVEVILDSTNGPRGFGLTDEEGAFTVQTRQFGAGLPAGTYRVLIAGSDRTRLRGSAEPVSGRDLRTALDAVLAGSAPAANQRPSIGCNIKWRA